jgi:hypothetical protein
VPAACAAAPLGSQRGAKLKRPAPPSATRRPPPPGILARKEAALVHLAQLNATAAASGHLDAAGAAPTPAFESEYATAVRDLQVTNAQLARAVASLEARPHLGLPPAQLEASVAAAAAAAQQQQAVAAAAALAAGGPEATAIGAVVADAAARAQQIVWAQRPAAAAAADGDATVAAALGSGAGADAAAGAAGAAPPAEDLELEELISSCVGVLLAAKLATAPDACPEADTAAAPDQAPRPPPGRRLPVGAAWAALDGALARLVPRSPASAAAYAAVRRAVEALKSELAQGGC